MSPGDKMWDDAVKVAKSIAEEIAERRHPTPRVYPPEVIRAQMISNIKQWVAAGHITTTDLIDIGLGICDAPELAEREDVATTIKKVIETPVSLGITPTVQKDIK